MTEKLYIQVGTRCNLNCKHCYMKSHIKKNAVDFKSIQYFVEHNIDIKDIYLCGGEPLCNNLGNLYNFINRNKNIKFHMTTNLIYDLNMNRRKIIKKIDYLHTSFDPKIRFTKPYHLFLWLHNLEKIKEIKDIDVNVCLTRYLIKISPRKISKFFNDLEVNYKIIPIIRYDQAMYNSLSPNRHEAEEWLTKLININDKRNLTTKNIDDRIFNKCKYYGSDEQCIDSKGNLVTCLIDHECDKKGKLLKKCSTCKNLFMCGSSCKYIDCYFFEDLYHKIIYNK